MEQKTICEYIRKAEADWTTGQTKHSEYVTFNIYETLNRIDAYLNSKHITGDKDAKGRDKPFFNIVTAAVNIWYRATEIFPKNIRIRATKMADTVNSFLGSILLQKWIRKSNWEMFIDDWGRTLARYGSAVCKFVEKNGDLISEVIPWNRMICDAVDFEGNPKIEKIWLTPAQLQKRIKTHGYNEDFVKQIIAKHATVTRETMSGQTKDNKADYIPIYEIHGEMELSYLTDDEEDSDTYVQQMQVVCFLEKNEKGKWDDYNLYKGKESKDPYMITHLIKEDGQTLSIGAVQHLFEAQWMTNHSQKLIKDNLDLCSKYITQTSDGNFVGRNILSNLEVGDILIHQQGQPLTRIDNRPDISATQAFQAQWQNIGREIVNTPEAQSGITPPSGTAWRLQETVIQQSQSLFELMKRNKKLAIKQMLIEYVIPHLKKKMDTTEEISEILESHQINWIDKRYITNQSIRNVNDIKKKTILSGQIYDPAQEPFDMANEQASLQAGLDMQGNQRFIKPSEINGVTWKKALEDVDWEIDITDENNSVQSALTTLSTVFQVIAGLNGQPMSPELRMVFDKILNLSGNISPIELSQLPKPQEPQMAVAQPGVGQAAQQFNNLTQ